MKGAFECTHCGACCKKETSPVNITLGDIKRISKFLGKDPKELIGNEIKIRPFMDAESPGRFELELGLPKPCHFWKDSKCSIYEARPLNCRLFPFWLYATQPDESIIEQALPGYDCVLNSKVDNDHRLTYREYSTILSRILMAESKETDEFMEINDFSDEVELEGHEEDFGTILGIPGKKTEEAFVRVIRDAETKIKIGKYAKLPETISEHLKNEAKFEPSEELAVVDEKLKGRYDS